MVNQRAFSQAADEDVAPHRHDAHAVRVTVGAEIRGVHIEYVCRSCGLIWSEDILPAASESTVSVGGPYFRRKPDRRQRN